MSDDFPADLRQFIIDHLNSVAELEVLLLLRTTPEKEWTAAEVGKSLYAATEVSAAQLANLHKCGFLKLQESSYVYAPTTYEIKDYVDRLAEVYKARHVSVITLIYSKPVDKVQTFADAFKFRREK